MIVKARIVVVDITTILKAKPTKYPYYDTVDEMRVVRRHRKKIRRRSKNNFTSKEGRRGKYTHTDRKK